LSWTFFDGILRGLLLERCLDLAILLSLIYSDGFEDIHCSLNVEVYALFSLHSDISELLIDLWEVSMDDGLVVLLVKDE
jgi:hypothetical protein